MNEFSGEITASFLDIRFAYAGLVSGVFKLNGDEITQGETIARLDRKLLQIELDKQLAAYEKIRADFELFSLKNGSGPDTQDTTKYLRQKTQAELNAAVKDIEMAKFKMDQSDMLCPVHGIVIDTQGLTAGLFITPASSPIIVLNLESLVFEMEIPQEELFQFINEREMKITFPGLGDPFVGKQKLPTRGKKGLFTIPIPLKQTAVLYPGMTGVATFKLD